MEELRAGPADRVLRQVMLAALAEQASDVHIEPMEEFVRIRFRRDGRLYDRYHLPSSMMKSLSVRAKVVGHMDVGEGRLPQDGSVGERIHDIPYDFRISILPSIYGETIVIRILSGRVEFIEKNDLGMLPAQKELFHRALAKRQGMILTTGPTGSGKTSTLYAAMKILNQEDVSIVSVENPVEYHISGITQMEVNEKAGLTFSRGLRSLLRQDPDIIMIGEIRDKETAEIAIHAALTGHLVLSTLHTDRAASAPLRLVDMGIPPYLLSASLSLIMAQRLVPKLCPFCKQKKILSHEEIAEKKFPAFWEGKTVWEAKGCAHCHDGEAGRTGVFELLPIGRKERAMIHDEVSADALEDHVSVSMGQAAVKYMEDGLISPETAALLLAEEE